MVVARGATAATLLYRLRQTQPPFGGILQDISKGIATEGKIIDVFSVAGLKKPEIGIHSPQFLAEVRSLKHRNVFSELLKTLPKEEMNVRSMKNLVLRHQFSRELKKILNAVRNRANSAEEVIEERFKLAKETDAAILRVAERLCAEWV